MRDDNLPPGVSANDIPGNGPDTPPIYSWADVHALLERATQGDTDWAYALIKHVDGLLGAARAIESVFIVDEQHYPSNAGRSPLQRLERQASALRQLAGVLDLLDTDYDEETRTSPEPAPAVWFVSERRRAVFDKIRPECRGCGDLYDPPGIDGKCPACEEPWRGNETTPRTS